MLTPTTDLQQVDQLRSNTIFSVRGLTGRWSGLIGLLLVLVVFTGGVYFLRIQESRFFLTIFCLVWLICLYGLVLQCILIFSPYFDLWFEREIEEYGARPGDSIRVFWKRKGGWGKPQRLRLWLVGKQVVVTAGGDGGNRVEAVFFEQLLEDQSELIQHDGDTLFPIPFDVIPSFALKNNALQWSVQLEVTVARRPNFRLSKLFYILPYRIDQLSSPIKR